MSINVLAIIDQILAIYGIIIVGAVVWRTLMVLGALPYRRWVVFIDELLRFPTEPLLRPLRRNLPLVGGLDFSPIVLLLLITLVRSML